MKHLLASAILAGGAALLAPAAQAQTVTYEWPLASINFSTSGSGCTIRLERAHAAGSPSWIHLQLRNTGSRGLTIGGAWNTSEPPAPGAFCPTPGAF